MKEFEVDGFIFRIKKMNAIEVLALQTQISFDSIEEAIHGYEAILERIEVKIKDSWIQVKQGKEFYPAGLEDDIKTTETLIKEMISYLKEVFRKSDASK